MEVGQKVLVYTDGIVGWEVGELKDKYRIAEESALEKWNIDGRCAYPLEKWRIETTLGTNIVRTVKISTIDTFELDEELRNNSIIKSFSFKSDGYGYPLEKDKKIKAKINFKNWDLEEWSETWDDPEYFKGLFSNKEEVYIFSWDGQEFFELISVEDERKNELFEPQQLIILEV